MTRISLARQLQAATLAHAEARAQFYQKLKAGALSDTEYALKLWHLQALRAVRETLITLLRDQAGGSFPAPGTARLFHDAMVAAHGAPDLSDSTDTGDQECEIP